MAVGLTAMLSAAVLGANAADRVFVVTSDPASGTGSSTVFDLEAPWAASVDVEPTGINTTVGHFVGRLYVVHPQTGDVQVIDPSSYDTVLTFSVGATSAPHDIQVVDAGMAYVSRNAGQPSLRGRSGNRGSPGHGGPWWPGGFRRRSRHVDDGVGRSTLVRADPASRRRPPPGLALLSRGR